MKTKPKNQVAERPINDRMRRVCELVVAGHPAGRAYEMAGYSARGEVADVCASQLLAKPKVAEYLRTLREAAAKQAEFGRDDLVGFLVKVIKTPVGEIGENNPLAQKSKVEADGGYLIEMPSKLGASKQLAEIMGWNKPTEVKVDLSEKLADIIGRVRRS